MTAVSTIDSNSTGLRYAEEASFKVLPGSPVWRPLEPNSYGDFGGSITTIARNPINDSRQRKKGVTTDLEASGDFNTDLTQTNLQDILQGFMFADLRLKGEEIVTAVDVDGANPDEYEVASSTGFLVNSIIKGSNFTNAANNAVNVVTAIVADTSIEVADGQLVAEASPPSDAQITVVGYQFDSATLDVIVSGNFPVYSRASGSVDFTTLGLIPGEWIFVGGDNASNRFVNTENNGFKRVKSVTATTIEIDKSDSAMVAETGTGLLINAYFGRVLKNELGSSIVKRSYQLERTLGAPDDALPAQIQSEYITGAIPSEFTMNIPAAEKITFDMAFIGADVEQRTGATGVKSGSRPAIVEADAFNTSSDFSRIKLSQIVDGSEAPTALFAFSEEITLTLNNNLAANKAVGTLGAIGISAGTFQVGGSITAYFADVAATQAVRNNVDITLDVIMVKSNTGIAIDVPLLSLGDGRPTVEQDEAIRLPLTSEAATAAKYDANMDHTLMFVFFDYLPNLADS